MLLVWILRGSRSFAEMCSGTNDSPPRDVLIQLRIFWQLVNRIVPISHIGLLLKWQAADWGWPLFGLTLPPHQLGLNHENFGFVGGAQPLPTVLRHVNGTPGVHGNDSQSLLRIGTFFLSGRYNFYKQPVVVGINIGDFRVYGQFRIVKFG